MKILLTFCVFLLIGCPKKPINDVEIQETTLLDRLGDHLEDLEEEEIDNLPEDTAID